jgi:SHS2 domain-containing protein
MYEIFEHTADVGIRVRAHDLNTLFAEAGRALFSVIVENLEEVRAQDTVAMEIRGQKTDFLLLDWLCELLFAFESRGLLLARFSVNVDDQGLTGTAEGEPLDRSRHHLEHEVKAVTYHGLRVERTDEGWLAEVILDI